MRPYMCPLRALPLGLVLQASLLGATLCAQTPALQTAAHVPGQNWTRYADVGQAGFDAARLEAARLEWERLPSSAFMLVAGGAVVASWGDVERRFMCHSVRKSLLAGLYGIYYDRGELELNKQLSDLGLDDEPLPLLAAEKRARILDLLKARSGVFHPAAYAGRTDSRPRGSEGPGRYFAYNNWDFNTLAHILKLETGADVFEAFDEHFAGPMGMQDYRVGDGYYHYELDKSKYPAYPFRLSARDAARFGLLYTRLGAWGDQRILSRNWVRRCTAEYSIDSDSMGYGFMWWTFREPRFEVHGMTSALGVGNQMIAALPDSDLVIVNRANTYDGESTPMDGLLDLIEQVLAARTGQAMTNPRLVPLAAQPVDPRCTSAPADALRDMAGTWPSPPAALGRATGENRLAIRDGHLVATLPNRGTFAMYLQADGTLFAADSGRTSYIIRSGPGNTGAFAGIADGGQITNGALLAASQGRREDAELLLSLLPSQGLDARLAPALLALLSGDVDEATTRVGELITQGTRGEIENRVNNIGYRFLGAQDPDSALRLFELNTIVFPRSANAWDSLAEVHLNLGNDEDALHFYEVSLELGNPNPLAPKAVARLREAASKRE